MTLRYGFIKVLLIQKVSLIGCRFGAYVLVLVDHVDAVESQRLRATSVEGERAQDNFDKRLPATSGIDIQLSRYLAIIKEIPFVYLLIGTKVR